MAPPATEKLFAERSSRSEVSSDRFWRWVVFSALVHGIVIVGFLLAPYMPARKAVSYRAYTVDLVGGEKLGGGGTVSVAKPAPEPQKKQTETPARPPEPLKEKKEKRKAAEPPAKIPEKAPAKNPEKIALDKTKIETKKQPRDEGLSGEVRDKLIQAALERVKERAATDARKETGPGGPAGPGQGAGASAPGVGGTGGGVVKGVEFINYLNQMRSVIRERWTWVGKRSDLEVKVRFGIQENGEIIGLKVVQRSGDASYDDSVVRALRRSSPLPPPPETYRKDFMDVELTFQPKDLGG